MAVYEESPETDIPCFPLLGPSLLPRIVSYRCLDLNYSLLHLSICGVLPCLLVFRTTSIP